MDGNQNKFWPLTLSIAMMLTATAASAVEENFDAARPRSAVAVVACLVRRL
jgi:hypothetical protein